MLKNHPSSSSPSQQFVTSNTFLEKDRTGTLLSMYLSMYLSRLLLGGAQPALQPQRRPSRLGRGGSFPAG